MPLTAAQMADAHQYFSASCFNLAWDLLDKTERTEQEHEEMLLLAQTSLWHWKQRPDCTEQNLSVGYWQLSRICAVLKRTPEAQKYAELSLARSLNAAPFFRGYSHEAAARAAFLAGDRNSGQIHLNEARRLTAEIEKADDRQVLAKDLDQIVQLFCQ